MTGKYRQRAAFRKNKAIAIFVWKLFTSAKLKIMSVANRVKSIIIAQLGVDENLVTAEASFIDDLGADSLDLVELVMAFEQEFGLEIPDEEAEKLSNVRDVVDYLEKRPGG